MRLLKVDLELQVTEANPEWGYLLFEYTSTAYRGREDRGRVVMGGCYTHPASAARPSLRLSHKLSGNLKTGLRLAWDDDT